MRLHSDLHFSRNRPWRSTPQYDRDSAAIPQRFPQRYCSDCKAILQQLQSDSPAITKRLRSDFKAFAPRLAAMIFKRFRQFRSDCTAISQRLRTDCAVTAQRLQSAFAVRCRVVPLEENGNDRGCKIHSFFSN
jgi:hypothetical protein